MTKRILLVEDDASLGFVIKDSLMMKGYEVFLCMDGERGHQAFEEGEFDVCILDVMMPKKDGFALAQSIRRKDKNIPILFITAKAMLEDKIAGFESGGDDYLVKPFNMEELCMRIEVFLRRSNGTAVGQEPVQLGEYVFDPRTLALKHPKGQRSLTQKEADVLALLWQSRDRILKREEILKKIWGDDDYFLGRSMDVFISKLRKYLKDDPSLEIVNYHGVGFRLEVKETK